MFATSSAFEVGELVRIEAKGFESKRTSLNATRPLLLFFLGFPVKLLTNFVVDRINKVARDFALRAVWFHGIRQQVEEGVALKPIDSDKTIRRLLDGLASHIVELRNASSHLLKSRSKRNMKGNGLTCAIQRVVQATDELLDEVNQFRITLQHHEEQWEFFAADPVFANVMRSAMSMREGVRKLKADNVNDFDAELLEEARITAEALSSSKQS